MNKSKKWLKSVSKPRPQYVKNAVSKAQKGRKHKPNEGFQKGHKAFAGTEKTRFKKGNPSVQKGKFGKDSTNYRHGMNSTPFYKKWQSMHQRCLNPNHKQYKDYGGRGITIEWKSFEEFKTDMYASYLDHVKQFGEKNTTIERIKNEGNYSNRNCRWATKAEQMRNNRRNHMLTYNGKTQCMSDWAKLLGISYAGLYKRMKKKPFEEIMQGYEI